MTPPVHEDAPACTSALPPCQVSAGAALFRAQPAQLARQAQRGDLRVRPFFVQKIN